MDELELQIAPQAGVEVPPDAPAVAVDATYARLVEDAATGATSAVKDTVRATLDARLQGTLPLAGLAPDAPVELAFMGASGAVRLRRTVSVEQRPVLVALTAAEVAAVTAPEPQPAPAPPTIDRRAYFVAVGEGRVPFRLSKLQVAPLLVGDGGWSAAGLDEVFHTEAARTTAIEWADPLPPALAAADWQPVRVGVDGRFSFTVPRSAGDAWAFWLTGPRPALGVVLDDLQLARPSWMAVPLPPFAVTGDDDAPGVPKDVTEAEVADNPEVYSEDPGAYCQPFKNPERVLGERSFFVILRAEQPVISAEATVRTEPVPTLTFERAQTAPTGLTTGTASAPLLTAVQPVLVRHAVPAAYLDMLAHHTRGRASMDAAHPLQWEGDASRYQATTVARGHILELRMRWRSNGYSLGTVAKTLTLAPRQTKRIQKIEWERRETARRQESTQLTDRVSDSLSQERHYEDSVRANLSEWARGESTSSTAAAAGGFGFAGPGFVVGGGGGGSRAHSESSQEGGRVASAAEEQRLRDSVRRYGDSLRRLESMVVTEVAQEESVTGTTEVVRNVNYGHALTVIYYQILRHLKIETGVAGVRECLFVPLPITPFTVGRAYRWREFLERGLRDGRYRSRCGTCATCCRTSPARTCRPAAGRTRRCATSPARSSSAWRSRDLPTRPTAHTTRRPGRS